MPQVKERRQRAFEEQILDDPEFERLLEHRQSFKEAMLEARAEFEEVNGEAGAKVRAMELGEEEVVRCGRFLLSMPAPADEKEVSFLRSPKRKPKIALAKDAAG